MSTIKLLSRVWLAVTFIMFLAQISVAAAPSFSVDSYIPEKFVDFRWRVDGGTRLNGDRHDVSADPSFMIDLEERSSSNDAQSLQLSTDIEYRHETIPRFLSLAVSLNGNLSHRNSLNSNILYDPSAVDYIDFSDGDYKSTGAGILWAADAGQYLTGDWFFAAGAELQTNYSESSNETARHDSAFYPPDYSGMVLIQNENDQRDNSSDFKYYNVDVNFMPGWGRMYEGQYAATALYIIDELQNAGLLRRTPTFDDMQGLTEIIYQYRLSHVIDKRLHKIGALSDVMEYLQSKGIIDDAGSHSSLLVEDVWDYFPNYYRKFGFKIRAGAGLEYNTRLQQGSQGMDRQMARVIHDENDPTDMDTTYSSDYQRVNFQHEKIEQLQAYLGLAAEYSRPINLRWQVDMTGEFRYYDNAYSTSVDQRIVYMDGMTTYDRLIDERIEYQASHTIDVQGIARYIFNSRTSADFLAEYFHRHYNSAIRTNVFDQQAGEITIGEPDRHNLSEGSLTMRGTLRYRIAIPTTLSVGLDYALTESEVYRTAVSEIDRHGYSLQVNISHYLY